MPNIKLEETGVKRTESSSRKGDLAEYYAVTWLWDNGYEVIQNAGCSGPIDIIAMDSKGEIILIDVKTAQIDKRPELKGDLAEHNYGSSGCGRTKRQIKLGVKLLLFNSKTRELRFVNHEKTKLKELHEGEQLEIF